MPDRSPALPKDESRSSLPPPSAPRPSVHPRAATGWATNGPGSTTSTGWAILGTGASVELASPGRRLGARVIDWMIMAVVVLFPLIAVFLLALGIGGFANENPEPFTDAETVALALALLAAVLTMALILAAYEVALVAMKGQTLGKMATRIKVVGADDGLVPGWTRSILRWIVPGVAGIMPLLQQVVYLSITWDNARQGWHDIAAGTLVIKA